MNIKTLLKVAVRILWIVWIAFIIIVLTRYMLEGSIEFVQRGRWVALWWGLLNIIIDSQVNKKQKL